MNCVKLAQPLGEIIFGNSDHNPDLIELVDVMLVSVGFIDPN